MSNNNQKLIGVPDLAKTFNLGGEVSINRLGFGAMRLPQNEWGGPARDPEVGRAVLRRAVELGVNHIDTADFYRSRDGSVRANTLIREALAPYPPGLVIATKVGPIFGPDGPFQGKASDLRRLVEGNLESLGVDCLDVVYLRIGMMEIPHGESISERFEALAAMREEGLIRHLALSNVDVNHLEEARAIAPVVAVQNIFNVSRKNDLDLLAACEHNNVGFAPFGPLGSGNTDISSERLLKVAARHNATVQQIALAWLLSLSPVTLAIAGTGSLKHLEENMAAQSIQLSPEDVAELA